MPKPPLVFTFYIAAPVEKVWDGFVSKDANQKIFMGADFEIDLKPGGLMAWDKCRRFRKKPPNYARVETW